MREQGGGTLFSQVIDRPKLSVKVAAPATESNESKRRLSNGGGMYASYGAGAKSILGGGSILPPAAAQANMQQRLKLGGSAGGAIVLGQRQSFSSTELHNLSAVERLKELRPSLEPLLKPKAAPLPPAPAGPPPPLPPPPLLLEERVAPPLPQWGPGKRARRSRCDAFKLIGTVFPAKALPLRTADEDASPLGTHGWPNSTPAFLESDGHSSKEVSVVARNVITSRGGTSVRQGLTGAERALGSGGLTFKSDPSSSFRQRSDSTAEVPIANNGSNGHMIGGAPHVNRATVASETVSASAFLHAKPRSELQALEWPRILIGLSRKEKEDDFLVLKGTKLPQRPKKRSKVVERTLHFCTPGNALCDLSRGRYDVREKKSVKKRPRGLKAMESVESDSD